MFVERIINYPVPSNCFVIYNEGQPECLVIDPGSSDCADLLQFFKKKNTNPQYIFLTHEHFDHIWGVNKLKDIFHCNIVCSKICAGKITNRKKNMSVFYDQSGFETYAADIHIEDLNHQLNWNNLDIEFITTRGHTDASICILINNNLYTGDTLLKNTKTVTKFPSGNQVELMESFSLLKKRFQDKRILVHPGHGESFWFEEIEKTLLA